jgi:prephenate dehydrogenase
VSDHELGIYGLGRFGTFWAERLARHTTVKAFSRRSRGAPVGVEVVSEERLLECPALILCVAISAMEQVLGRIGDRLPAGVTVMDTCSVKAHPTRLMAALLPAHARILGTHPMFGPDSGRETIAGRPLVLCPVRIDAEPLAHWERFFTGLQLNVVVMEPDAHDREAAFTQGVTHYVGRVLAEMRLRESGIAPLGYQRLLSIVEQTCNDPWQLFADLQRFNPHTVEMRARLEEAFRSISARLDDAPENS